MARNPSSTGGPSTPQPGDDQISGPDRPGDASYGTGGPPYGPGGPSGPGGGGRYKQRVHPATIAAIVVIAAALGAILVLVLANHPGSTPSANTAPSTPASSAPAQSGTGGGGNSSSGVGIPGAPPQVFMAGRVMAISSNSITIGGPSHTIKADITSATKFNGKATSAGAVKVGDIVTAQIDNTKNPAVVTALQDPAQIP
jgi:hypothetical protein